MRDQIIFGRGPEAARLGSGLNPSFCNLQLAVARVLKTSGAAEAIARTEMSRILLMLTRFL